MRWIALLAAVLFFLTVHRYLRIRRRFLAAVKRNVVAMLREGYEMDMGEIRGSLASWGIEVDRVDMAIILDELVTEKLIFARTVQCPVYLRGEPAVKSIYRA